MRIFSGFPRIRKHPGKLRYENSFSPATDNSVLISKKIILREIIKKKAAFRIPHSLVLLHKEVGPVANVEVCNDHAQSRHRPQERPEVLDRGRLALGGSGLESARVFGR